MDSGADSLSRFIEAQENVYSEALSELRAGAKRTHWVWFILPQLRNLGRSSTALYYGLSGPDEARRYLQHPTLGPRLVQCVKAITIHSNRTAIQMLGETDALKFRSCLTLFETIAPDEPCFAKALDLFYGGRRDPLTLKALAAKD